MGLSGRKEKQRIGHDPRNLSWADDANKFGTAYLQKLGWAEGSGLGSNGDGRVSHIKVSQKLDMLGIGAAHQKDPNGVAWKQNKDFESLLRRLNNGGADAGEDEEDMKVDGFASASASVKQEEEAAEKMDPDEDGEGTKKKKRKRSKNSTSDEEKAAKKSKKERKADKKEKRSKKSEETNADDSASAPEAGPSSIPRAPPAGPPHRAHRARFLAAKRLAIGADSAMDEILGISRSGTATPYPNSSIPQSTADTPHVEGLQELTTSSKSVMDYFKDKLLAKSNAGASTFSTPGLSSAPSPKIEDDDYDDKPKGGLGLGASRGIGAGLKTESTVKVEVEEVTERRGLGSRFTSMFTSASLSTEVTEVRVTEEETGEQTRSDTKEKKKRKRQDAEVESPPSEEDSEKQTGKKEKKEKRRKSAVVVVEPETEGGDDGAVKEKKKKRKTKDT
ncbi:hypothetical protein EUX98_g3309 [Antrodiella citrinella]|uniref:PinX1-related protein 1 n=1 Tax=Antrodiella citrinella TaxID=2447956 RepID=A0A4S4MWT8_9APHY|nr:hypothetical protein EUX98_g3309 [Antrodiella citrinella]